MKILIIEDESLQKHLLSIMFTQMNHNADFADSGIEAFELRKKNTYDIIFMDIHMPFQDGIESTELIRAWEARNSLRPVPIFALTADNSEDTRKRCVEAGMTGFLTKPIRIHDLSSALNLVAK